MEGTGDNADDQSPHDEEGRPAKKVRIEVEVSTVETDDKRAPQEPHCLVCMEPDAPDSPLQKHQCDQCAAESWMVCVCCNEALLSRTCPVCRGNYAPIVMHPMPGLPLKRLGDSTISADERAELLYKFGVVRQLISKSNVAVWTPADSQMHFTLPQKMTEAAEDKDVQVVVVSIPFAANRLVSGTFLFTNAIWDEIENIIEAGAVQAGEVVDLQRASTWLLAHTKSDGHALFTMMAPADWAYMLDPGESPDINDALKAIRESIVSTIRMPAAEAEGTTGKEVV